jgi:glycosyltransferase involved in cell wall biosynthesis
MDKIQPAALSVFIIAKNEADRIGKVISAVKSIADEVLVIDSGSTDKTCEIAQNLGAKVIFNQWKGYGAQKIFGENQCRNKWILNIDADEEVMPELAQEISDLFVRNKQEGLHGFRVRIVNKFPGEKSPKKLAYYYNQLRLYHIDHAGFSSSTVHDSVILKDSQNAKVGQLKNIIWHESFRSYAHWIEKLNSYSQMQAEDAVKKGKIPSNLKIFFSPIFAFFKAYFVRRYFIYGFDGVTYSFLFALSRVAKLVKIRELVETNSAK